LSRYLAEFDFKYNNRSKLGVEDTEPAAETVFGAEGRVLEDAKILSWVNRIKRIREPCPDLLGATGWRWRVLQTSNSYAFNA
jgi:hypothetical protein